MTRPLLIGIAFDGFISTGEAIALAQRAVAAGAGSLWVAEHLGYREAIATCMAFAMKTPGPLLVPTAVSPYLWHPTPTAMAMATLDEVAPGCAAIAVGAGNPLFLQESGRAVEKPVRAMREFTEALRKLWSGEAVHVDGAVNAAGVQKDLDFFLKQGWVTGQIKAADVIDMSFAQKASAALGPYQRKSQ